jgi:hypothetical protein
MAETARLRLFPSEDGKSWLNLLPPDGPALPPAVCLPDVL